MLIFVILVSMKKTLLIFFLFLTLLISCQTSEKASYLERNEDENIRANEALISAEREALASIESSLFKDNINIQPTESLLLYLEEIPMFSSTLSDYYKAIQEILINSLPQIVDTLYSMIDELSFEYPYFYIESDYSSVTTVLTENQYETIFNLFLTSINDNTDSLNSAFAKVEREALIWKTNQSNLEIVNAGKDLPNPEKILSTAIAAYASNEVFNSLANAEKIVRTRPLSKASNELYSVFWEDLADE